MGFFVKELRRIALYLVRWIVRYRVALFIATMAVAVWSAFLIPQININTDMSRYLPESYEMKQGMDILDAEFPHLKEQGQEFTTAFSQGEETLPKGLGKTMIIGVVLVFVILLIMSTSVLEVVLFLITIGVAVLINFGTNAFLDSVSLTTNTIAPVLQMVLSMDYCIILMNRYRDERTRGKTQVEAMNLAVGGSAATILSSAFTTIVSLLMLCFIKLKIGADLGVVLAQGVAISLVCNFTLLPALIIWCSKAIETSRKKVPVLPAAPMARFQYRFRIPISILFLVAAVSFTLLQLKTPLFFAPPKWEDDSDSTTVVNKYNPLLLIYDNSDTDAITGLLDTIATDSKVVDCYSYPTLADKPRTPEEMTTLFRTHAGNDVPAMAEDLLKLVYYAHAHPERGEKFSLNDLKKSSETLRQSGLLPPDRDMDFEGMVQKAILKATAPTKPKASTGAATGGSTSSPTGGQESSSGTIVSPADSTGGSTNASSGTIVSPADSTGGSAGSPTGGQDSGSGNTSVTPSSRPTYEQITTPMTAGELAEFLGTNPQQVSLLFRMAGKKGGKMSPNEFIRYVRKNILGKKAYAAFLPKGTNEQMAQAEALYDEILAAGPTPSDTPGAEGDPLGPAGPRDDSSMDGQQDDNATVGQQEGNATVEQQDDNGSTGSGASVNPSGAKESTAAPTKKTTKEVASPIDKLLDMYMSGKKYSADVIARRLRRVGVPVSNQEMDLFFLYTAASQSEEPTEKLSPVHLLTYLADTLFTSPALAGLAPEGTRDIITHARDSLLNGVSVLQGEKHSAAAVLTTYEVESEDSFAFIERIQSLTDEKLSTDAYWVGESEMYKEIKDGFPQELLLLTLLTVLSIFIIVALNFRSVLVPIPLIMTVLSGVYINVWASGLGGQSMYYLAYLIVQGILMGATIDYSILFTSYYLGNRQNIGPLAALEAAYKGSSHSILTSGSILAVVPLAMSFTMPDVIVASILKSLSIGAFAVLFFIIFLLPGVLALLDVILKPRKKFQK